MLRRSKVDSESLTDFQAKLAQKSNDLKNALLAARKEEESMIETKSEIE